MGTVLQHNKYMSVLPAEHRSLPLYRSVVEGLNPDIIVYRSKFGIKRSGIFIQNPPKNTFGMFLFGH